MGSCNPVSVWHVTPVRRFLHAMRYHMRCIDDFLQSRGMHPLACTSAHGRRELAHGAFLQHGMHDFVLVFLDCKKWRQLTCTNKTVARHEPGRFKKSSFFFLSKSHAANSCWLFGFYVGILLCVNMCEFILFSPNWLRTCSTVITYLHVFLAIMLLHT